MTLEQLEWLGWSVLIATILAALLKSFLLASSIWARGATMATSPTELEKTIADQDVLDNIGRLGYVLLIAAVATIWVVGMRLLPEEVRARASVIAPVWVAIATLMFLQASLAVLQGVRGLLYTQRIRALASNQRDSCANNTTFADCPYISQDRLERLKTLAAELHEGLSEAATEVSTEPAEPG